MTLLLNLLTAFFGLLVFLGAFASASLLGAALILPVFSVPVTEHTVTAQLSLAALSIATFAVTCILSLVARLVADRTI